LTFAYHLQVTVDDKGLLNITSDTAEWTKISEAELLFPVSDCQLVRLRPSAHYQVEVRAKNDKGWSEAGPVFVFTTGEGEVVCLCLFYI